MTRSTAGSNLSCRSILTTLSIGCAYFLVVRYTGLSIPCPFRLITGYLCPGCGITTMMLALLSGDIQTAIVANPFLFYTGPLLITCSLYYYIGKQNWLMKGIEKGFFPLYLLGLLAFAFYRNGIW